jgi:hypothetical protein
VNLHAANRGERRRLLGKRDHNGDLGVVVLKRDGRIAQAKIVPAIDFPDDDNVARSSGCGISPAG